MHLGLSSISAQSLKTHRGISCCKRGLPASRPSCVSLPGVLNLPAVAVGIFLGGLLMKRYKLSLVSGAQLSFATSFLAYLLLLLQFGTKCDNIPVAGLTISYNGSVLRHEGYTKVLQQTKIMCHGNSNAIFRF